MRSSAQTKTAPILAKPARMPALVRWLKSVWREFRRHDEQRRAIAELRAMSDRQLRDLGIGRTDILRVVCESDHSRQIA